jgi:hypothetical protein
MAEAINRWQQFIGLVNIVLILPWIVVLGAMGRALQTSLAAVPEVRVLPVTGPLVEVSSFIDTYWYAFVALMLAAYFLWVRKRQLRLLWFNAVLAIVLPSVLFLCLLICYEQQQIFIEHGMALIRKNRQKTQ